jgi:ATP-binding cassette subfamily C protein CydD
MRRFLVAAVLLGTLGAALTITCAVVLGQLVATVITDPAARTLGTCGGAVALLALLWGARALAGWLQGRLGQSGATAVISDLNARVLAAVTALDPRTRETVRDRAAVVITGGLDALRPYLTGYLPALVLAALLTPAAAITVGFVDTTSALVIVLVLPLIPVFMVLIGMATAARSRAALAAMGALQSQILDLVAGLPTLRALGRAGQPVARIAKLVDTHRRSTMRTLKVAFLSALALELLATLGVALVAVAVGLRLVYGELTLAAGLTALLLAPEVFWPLRRLGVEYHAASAGKAALAEAGDLLDRTAPRTAGTVVVAARGTRIELRDISVHSRDGMRPDGLSADLEPGRVTVLTGPNGAGKTTALQAILGLQPLDGGRITVGGVDVADLYLPGWWHQVAWQAQRPVLIASSVATNLALFGPLPDLSSACVRSGFDEVLASLPDGLLTVLAEGGAGLSLGQRQRLGLTRVLGSPAPVLLLDEPTAHLDSGTEARVLSTLRARADDGATVIVVSHRPAVLQMADAVITVGAVADAAR